MKMNRLTAIFAVALAASHSAWSINKCTGPDGKVSFQDAPCRSGKSEQVQLQSAPTDDGAAAGRAHPERTIKQRAEMLGAINRGEPVVGMTSRELEQTMGAPNSAESASYNGEPQEQLIYKRQDRTWYVYIRNGVVQSVQNTEPAGGAGRNVRCPTTIEIRNLETSASSTTISATQRSALHEQIRQAKNCGR